MADYKAKRHSILLGLKAELDRGQRATTVTVLGKKFELQTLNEDEEVWAEQHVTAGTAVSLLSSRKAPRLAAAIKSIDGTPVDQLFTYPDDMPPEKRKQFDENAILKRWWIRQQMLMFLSEDGCRPFINELYSAYERLDDERLEAIKSIPNL